ncbi:TetR/AcrR family transcriptional regulator [Rathayibacter soli]|uniref:TetR/AcrR family transcriptional regulator n=1 Tax=Rathayibacter soli TaxID=3144168 RepID=UPI0027E5274A|nr:helix-turn-helix domain-containing protein [Glaciibacter superstes]
MTSTGDGELSRQAKVGAASRLGTQNRLRLAASEEFEEHGYAGATVSRIANRAGVTVQTLYLAWGSKRELLRASLTSSLAEHLGPPGGIGGLFEGKTAREVITLLATLMGKTAEAAGTGWKLYRDAAATDTEIAADWDQLQSLRRGTMESIVAHIPDDSLRRGLSREAARDTAWVIASPESYELLVVRNGYSTQDFVHWMDATLTAALLA